MAWHGMACSIVCGRAIGRLREGEGACAFIGSAPPITLPTGHGPLPACGRSEEYGGLPLCPFGCERRALSACVRVRVLSACAALCVCWPQMEQSFSMQVNMGLQQDGESDDLKRVLLEGNPYLLVGTACHAMRYGVMRACACVWGGGGHATGRATPAVQTNMARC